ncbi:MAG: hypothetical protein LBL34_06365 [Clostridiales bacterium]|jgi:hypothetical protein|nr:hypothetical protein [Clostridiales bacterium]
MEFVDYTGYNQSSKEISAELQGSDKMREFIEQANDIAENEIIDFLNSSSFKRQLPLAAERKLNRDLQSGDMYRHIDGAFTIEQHPERINGYGDPVGAKYNMSFSKESAQWQLNSRVSDEKDKIMTEIHKSTITELSNGNTRELNTDAKEKIYRELCRPENQGYLSYNNSGQPQIDSSFMQSTVQKMSKQNIYFERVSEANNRKAQQASFNSMLDEIRSINPFSGLQREPQASQSRLQSSFNSNSSLITGSRMASNVTDSFANHRQEMDRMRQGFDAMKAQVDKAFGGNPFSKR